MVLRIFVKYAMYMPFHCEMFVEISPQTDGNGFNKFLRLIYIPRLAFELEIVRKEDWYVDKNISKNESIIVKEKKIQWHFVPEKTQKTAQRLKKYQ